jgi:hypothetical protein
LAQENQCDIFGFYQQDFMPKVAEDLRVQGITFEDAVKRMIAAPPPPTSKKAKQQKAANRTRRKSN